MKKNLGLLMILIAVMAVTAILDQRFLQSTNLQNVARWTGLYGLLTIGEAFVIITGGIDLSVGSIVGLTGSLLPYWLREIGMPLWLALPLVMAVAVGIGCIHAVLITKMRLQPFIVTLCGLFIYRGMARYITGDATQGFGTGYQELRYLASGSPPIPVPSIDWLPVLFFYLPVPSFNWIQIPFSFIYLTIVALLAGLFLSQTQYGRYLYAVGSNEVAARLSGIATHRVIGMAYIISATLAGLAGILFALDINSVQPSSHGNFFELYAIAGAVLGGCSLRGGTGSILGVVIGAAIVRVLYNAINVLGIATQLEFAVIGGVILLGVTIDELAKRYWRKESS